MLRILLAEDDQVMREYLTRALERSGYAVTAVDRGTAAIPLLETEKFDWTVAKPTNTRTNTHRRVYSGCRCYTCIHAMNPINAFPSHISANPNCPFSGYGKTHNHPTKSQIL